MLGIIPIALIDCFRNENILFFPAKYAVKMIEIPISNLLFSEICKQKFIADKIKHP